MEASAYRLFIGIDVPDDVRARIAAVVEPLRATRPALRWTDPQRWHLTVAFLGDVAPGDVEAVTDVMTAAAGSVEQEIRLATGAAGRFGNRVLWLGLDDDPAGSVTRLGTDLQRALGDRDLPVDPKPVRPHLTLARGRGRRAPVGHAVVAACQPPQAAWTAVEMVLWRSHLGSGHEPLARARLGA